MAATPARNGYLPGNQAVLRRLSAAPVAPQARLRIGAVDDPLEREADAAAEAVMGATTPVPSLGSGPPGVQRQCADCEDEGGPTLRRRAPEQAGVGEMAPAGVDSVLAQPGRPLPSETRAFFEARFGQDFGGVRVHDDPAAAGSARSVGAQAYTVGQHIAFDRGQYSPETPAGRRLLAHELAHTLQQEPGRLSRQPAATAPEPACDRTYKPAHSFRQLVDLIRAAEVQLIAGGKSDVGDRVNMLRGVFYGTLWSTDYRDEKSAFRNQGFQTYTGTVLSPDDPRPLLKCGVFEALASSQDVVDPGGRKVDVGHLLIGMDARRSWTARNVAIPSQGAAGLAIATWLGDLGGGAAMVAKARSLSPKVRARSRFVGSDFGGPINLEGDVAGYLVGKEQAVQGAPSALAIPETGMIADALETYLEPAGAKAAGAWNTRCRGMLDALGGVFDKSGALQNRDALVGLLGEQIAAFGCWYLVNRLRQTGGLTLPVLRSASLHLDGAARETASIFVDALTHCQSHPGSSLQARTDPDPSPPGKASHFCETAISALEMKEGVETWGREKAREAEEAIRQLKNWWDR